MSDNSKEVETSKATAPASGSYSEHEYELGLRVVNSDAIADPGLEPHRVRMTDKSVKHEKAAVRQVALLFTLSMLGSAFALWAYFNFPLSEDLSSVRLNTMYLGIGMTLGLMGIGIGAVHWAKTLMPDNEVSEERHLVRGSDEKMIYVETGLDENHEGVITSFIKDYRLKNINLELLGFKEKYNIHNETSVTSSQKK